MLCYPDIVQAFRVGSVILNQSGFGFHMADLVIFFIFLTFFINFNELSSSFLILFMIYKYKNLYMLKIYISIDT